MFKKFESFDPNSDGPEILDPNSNYGVGYDFDKQMGCPICNAVMKINEPIDVTQQLTYTCKPCGITVNPKVKQLKKVKGEPMSVLGDNAFKAQQDRGAMSIEDNSKIETVMTPGLPEDHNIGKAPVIDESYRHDYFARTVNSNLKKHESDAIIHEVT